MVWQGPRLGFVAETGRFVAVETLWVRFSCLLAFVPCFLLLVFRFSLLCFFSLHPGMFIFFMSLRLCSSHLLLSSSTYFIVRVLPACVICTLPHLGIVLFLLVYYFWVASSLLCSRTRYASTWFAYLDYFAFVFSLPHCLTTNLYLSRMKNQEGHWGYCWCRWVERMV